MKTHNLKKIVLLISVGVIVLSAFQAYAAEPAADTESIIVEKAKVNTVGNMENPVRIGIWQYNNSTGDYSFIPNPSKPNVLCNTWACIYSDTLKSANWYYFNIFGKMVTDWQEINGKSYYFIPSGEQIGICMLGPGFAPDGKEIDANGAWTGRTRAEIEAAATNKGE